MNKTVDWCTEKMQTKHILWVQKKLQNSLEHCIICPSKKATG